MFWIILAVVLVIAVFVVLKLSQKTGLEADSYPYNKIGVLFTPAERSFLGVLKQAVGENASIFGKVRVADVVAPKKGLTRSDWQKAFNKISGKHFDYLLCSNDDLSVICVIELDDSSHQSKSRQKRDEFLNGVCETAGIPLIHMPAKSVYAIADVKRLLAPHLNTKELLIQETKHLERESVADEKVCPKCSSPLVKRIAKKGSNAGKEFWACSAYPKCRYIDGSKA